MLKRNVCSSLDFFFFLCLFLWVFCFKHTLWSFCLEAAKNWSRYFRGQLSSVWLQRQWGRNWCLADVHNSSERHTVPKANSVGHCGQVSKVFTELILLSRGGKEEALHIWTSSLAPCPDAAPWCDTFVYCNIADGSQVTGTLALHRHSTKPVPKVLFIKQALLFFSSSLSFWGCCLTFWQTCSSHAALWTCLQSVLFEIFVLQFHLKILYVEWLSF